MRRRSSETDRGGGARSREGSGSGGSDAAEGGNLGAEKPARSGVEEEEVLLSGDGGDAGVALRSEEESESKLRARGGRQVMRRSSMVAKQVISIESALGLGYIERIAVVSVNNDSIAFSSDEVIQWMHKIQEWNPKFFTLSHVPEKYRQAVSKFFRRVLIARMAESPDLASSYHRKLKEAYHTEEKLRDPEVVRRSKEHLIRLLDEIEDSLSKTYIAGEEFSMADRRNVHSGASSFGTLEFGRRVYKQQAKHGQILEFGSAKAFLQKSDRKILWRLEEVQDPG
ncbi:hypothetical protein EUGRSUZ_J01273 [Eucalyptus grandis]|uniref:Uncharacterized protein n=2 Tax=Eucalyptus grandis TaxID=71139 RepID=A0ACC3J666_EUCGR|nr:hypothetical protein EUGRSUZ_J01273 [Eucalyptus grandis]